MTTYDKLYATGGFRYTTAFGIKHLNAINRTYKIFIPGTNILDAPSGDGFFSLLLRNNYGCAVTPVDQSHVASNLAGGVKWNLELTKEEWTPHKFDLVFCRGLSHFHHEKIPTQRTCDVLYNLMNYAPKVLLIYSTNQSNKMYKNHFHHKRHTLDKFLRFIGTFKSRMIGGYYTALIDARGIEGDLS